MVKYKDEKWLREQREVQFRELNDIAQEFGVSRKTISYYCSKYGIRTRKQKTDDIKVEILCNECRKPTSKTLKYLKSRIRKGKYNFHCSRKCADKAHSKRMEGKGNPNYEGKRHSQCPSTWSEEKWQVVSEKISRTMIERGTSSGENNPRWAGGLQKHDCVICGKTAEFRPYIHRRIINGEQSPTCSNECATALGRRNIKLESTSIEIKMAEELSRRGIEYVEQYILNDKFRLDFLLPEYDIVIECDGDYWHTLPDVVKRDRAKNAYIKTCGYSLYRFWEHEINADIEACVDVVMAEINSKELYRN